MRRFDPEAWRDEQADEAWRDEHLGLLAHRPDQAQELLDELAWQRWIAAKNEWYRTDPEARFRVDDVLAELRLRDRERARYELTPVQRALRRLEED